MLASACSGPGEAAESEEPVVRQAQALAGAAPPSEQLTPPAARESNSDIAQLLSAMDVLGPGADDAFNQARQRYLRSDPTGAKLRQAYRDLPAGARSDASKIVFAASRLPNDESVRLLEEVALSRTAIFRDPHAEPRNGRFDDPGAVDLAVKIQAAIGIAQQSIATPSATARGSIAKILAEGDPEVSRMLALELFARGRLLPEQRSALESRGIFAAFRRLTKAEEDAFRKLDPIGTAAPEKPQSQKTVYTTVPPEAK